MLEMCHCEKVMQVLFLFQQGMKWSAQMHMHAHTLEAS